MYNSIQCPENYVDEVTKSAAAKKFITDFLSINPEASLGNLGMARLSFFQINNCQETLKRINDRGGEDEYIKSIISGAQVIE